MRRHLGAARIRGGVGLARRIHVGVAALLQLQLQLGLGEARLENVFQTIVGQGSMDRIVAGSVRLLWITAFVAQATKHRAAVYLLRT